MGEATTARTYNQDHASRKYSRGHRRVSVYVTWSYPGEANRDPTVLDNRFSLNVEGTYSMNMNQQRTVDINFAPKLKRFVPVLHGL
jgi:hypothetical protein